MDLELKVEFYIKESRSVLKTIHEVCSETKFSLEKLSDYNLKNKLFIKDS